MIAWNCSSLGSISEDIQSLISMTWFKTWLPLSNKLCLGVAIFIANGIRSYFYLSFCCTQTIVKAPFDFRWWIPKQWSLHILFSEMYESIFSFRHVTQIYRHNKLRVCTTGVARDIGALYFCCRFLCNSKLWKCTAYVNK